MKTLQVLLFILLSCGMVIPSHAQYNPDEIEANEKSQLIDSITSILDVSYVFPEVALKMNKLLRNNLASGAYNKIKDPQKFAEVLTKEVQSVSNDLHLRIQFDPESIARRRNAALSSEDSIAFAKSRLQRNKARNYGFQEVRILDGNIGYLNLIGFSNVDEEAGATAQSAMNFLGNADALIIDLRQNGGGSPSMIQLITSYLYGPEPVHLNNFYNRPRDEHTQTWTLPYVPGKRRPDIDVYVLTSQSTFSAAEEFSYNLRNLERANLIGETTGGGAHPGGTQIVTNRFTIWVPEGRAINPITKTNWEGVGVEPHMKVSANEALEVAQITALETILKRNKDKGEDTFGIEWALEGLKAAKNQVAIEEAKLKSYAGNYGPRKLTFKNGKLHYQREGDNEYVLIPMTEKRFLIEEIPYFRIEMLQEDGKVVAIQGNYSNGRSDKSLRNGQ
ncbi:S41 family peptidase [Maribacter halichondriae]|uniref:S41 family peptidase n=1 Tax=Maribacter halichondriae TaxID=2980554 RepID=UPI002359D6FC|nr:S41 family peptidase [Maribacter sp. Hal144]